MADELAVAVEAHSFDKLEQPGAGATARSISAILDALLASLTAAPPRQGLVKGNDAADLETLTALAREPEIRALGTWPGTVAAAVGGLSDPRTSASVADETHRRCARVFGHIAADGTLPTDWLAGQIASVERTDGDLDTLKQRLAGIRIWSYIAARSDWVSDAAHWQGRAREVEDKLSDALHERLTARFVDRRATQLMRRLDAGEGQELLSAVTRRGEVIVEGHQVGHVAGFGFSPDPLAVGDEKKLVWRAARRALREEMPRRVARAEAAPDSAFGWTDCHGAVGHSAVGHAAPGNGTAGHGAAAHRITWDGVAIARLRPGANALRPRVEVLDSEFLDGAQRERLRTRLQAYVEARLRADLAPLFAVMSHAEAVREARGLLHCLREGLGVVADASAEQLAPLLRGQLKQIGVQAGRFALFMPALMKARPAAMRARLWALQRGLAVPELPAPGLASSRHPIGRLASPRLRDGWKPDRCCCVWMSRSGSRWSAWATTAWPHRAAGGAGGAVCDQGRTGAGCAARAGVPGVAGRRSGAGRVRAADAGDAGAAETPAGGAG